MAWSVSYLESVTEVTKRKQVEPTAFGFLQQFSRFITMLLQYPLAPCQEADQAGEVWLDVQRCNFEKTGI